MSAATNVRTPRFGCRGRAIKNIFAKPCYRRRRRCYLNLSADARFARLPITEKQRISCLLHVAVLKVSANVLKSDTVKQSIYLASGE